ncbi:MAG: hypothetical protein LLG00_13925 [Planctomycetaceae bacterium]|nr:hypothetical protein [Planctomycetaceae bacterium]
MSKQCNELQRMLELATAEQDTAQVDLDPETASFRDAWLVFGQLLESSQSTFEPAADVWVRPRTKPRGRWLLSAAAALAASLLIAAVWLSAFQSKQIAKVQQSTPHVVQVANLPVTSSGIVTTGSKWDDSWDDQVAQVGQSVLYAHQDLYASSEPARAVQYGIEQVRQDVDDSKL